MREVDSIAFHNKRDILGCNSNLPKVVNLWGRNCIEQKDIILHREAKDVILMQYTGFKIKNTELYQNDLVGVYNSENQLISVIKIEFDMTYKSDFIKIIKGSIQDINDKLDISLSTDYDLTLGYFIEWFNAELIESNGYYRIIGNIHDNPELLEVSKC